MANALAVIERIGNRLPDPALLFVLFLALVWALSWALSGSTFDVIDPRTGAPLVVHDQLSGPALAQFFATLTATFVSFPPLGAVLVALLGMGVAEHSGFIDAALKAGLSVTPRALLTPAVVLAGLLSHTAADAGYVLVIPLAGALFHAVGRHPLAGICAAFAGVGAGFAANVIPSAIDPLLAGLTEAAARIVDPGYVVNPLANWTFNSAAVLLLVPLGWIVTDRVVTPRLAATPVDGEGAEGGRVESLLPRERRGLAAGVVAVAVAVVGVGAWVAPSDSPWRAPDGAITSAAAPLMQAMVPLIFVLGLLPGVVYGYVSGRFRTHRDVIAGMSRAMSSMGYYLVMAFTASLFIAAFTRSNLGALLALEGAQILREAALPPQITVLGLMALANGINLLIASASAKWALLAPIFVPMAMGVGISPELTQAAYRVADSTSNAVTPMNAYFPLVVVFCQRWSRGAGLGTLVSLMVPYWLVFSVVWTAFLLAYWAAGLPLGIGGGYTYPPP